MAKTPPNILTAKDRLYMEDIMNFSMVYYRKSKHFTSVVRDADSKRKLEEFSKMLTHHYEELLKILQEKASAKGGIVNG